MKAMVRSLVVSCLALSMYPVVHAQVPQTAKDAVYYSATTTEETETDEYTRYELLAPETASFKIYYEVTATTGGAKVFYIPSAKGSVASDESVHDDMSGKPLPFEVVSGAEARKDALMADADLDTDYINSDSHPVSSGDVEHFYYDLHLCGIGLACDLFQKIARSQDRVTSRGKHVSSSCRSKSRFATLVISRTALRDYWSEFTNAPE